MIAGSRPSDLETIPPVDAPVTSTTAAEPTPVVDLELACAKFLSATAPLTDLSDLVSTDADAARLALATWLEELDDLRASVEGAVDPSTIDGLIDTRIAVRAAIDIEDLRSPSIVSIQRVFRATLDAEPGFGPCRR
ncbi:MAG: hypothetical protein HKN94_04345 [Acidimicrobiales bacterium]|nr:hypothetical protein [Acidimicrobiales bacterium]NND13653.1 hypothetical protein [Acidimicrobiia bacterium]